MASSLQGRLAIPLWWIALWNFIIKQFRMKQFRIMKIDLVTFETFDEAEPVVSILRREWEILYVCLIAITVFVDCDTDVYA